MISDEVFGILQLLRAAEQLKNVYRTAWTSGGRPESTADHTWRLSLSALLFAEEFPGINVERLLKLCIIHDLGEAIGGDIPAIYQDAAAPKAEQEREDLVTLLHPLPAALRQKIIALWDEYEAATTPEAKLAKALDKIETIMQHNQGANPPNFDYAFNIEYARHYTDAVPLMAAVRSLLDEETRQNALTQNQSLLGATMQPYPVLETLFRHNLWANLQLLEVCAALDDEQLQSSIVGVYGSIGDTLEHFVRSEASYLHRISTGKPLARPENAPRLTAAEMHESLQLSGAGLIEWASNVAATDSVEVRWENGQLVDVPKAVILTQAINHATEHRAQIMAMLTQLGIQPPDLDGWSFFEAQ